MMNYPEAFFSTKAKNLPPKIEENIIALFGVDTLDQLSDSQLVSIGAGTKQLFATTGFTDYHNYAKEYTLYYFPVNFYKIWKPLTDLLITDSLPEKGKFLELGAGPGSSTLALIEYYKVLAGANPQIQFSIDLKIVERESEFVRILRSMLGLSTVALPSNLRLSYEIISGDAVKFLENKTGRYDVIYESNMLNPNEFGNETKTLSFAYNIANSLNPNSSVIMIEPGASNLKATINKVKTAIRRQGLRQYSPCSCNHQSCRQYITQYVDTSEMTILKDLQRKKIITVAKQKNHSFEYTVYRNDDFSKYDLPVPTAIFSNLDTYLGNMINFTATILGRTEKEESILLKVCNGTAKEDVIWFSLPQKLLPEELNSMLKRGHGGLIKVKNATVVGTHKIIATEETSIELLF